MWNFLLETTDATGGPLSLVLNIGLIVLVVVAFYFLLIRPQRKQTKAANEMRESLQIGDEVTTIGGIIGQIVSLKGETVTIVTSKNKTKIRFLKTAIRNIDAKADGSAPSDKAKAPDSDIPAVEAPATPNNEKPNA